MRTQPVENQSTQTDRTALDPDTTAPVKSAPEERTHRSGRAAMVIAALAVSGVGLIALGIGVSDGSDTDPPPNPNVPPSVEMEAPRGIDQRLYELAEKHAAELEAHREPGIPRGR